MNPNRNIYVLGTHALSQAYCKKLIEGQTLCLVEAKEIVCVDNPAEFILKHFDEKLSTNDLMIPDHTAKHVMLQVCMDMAKEFPIHLSPILSEVTTPFLHKSDNDAIWAMSFATWSCPPDCTEPEICPHIAGPRTWEMGDVMKGLGADFIFPCHLVYKEIAGIGFDLIHTELSRFVEKLKGPLPLEVTVATHSHCHGIVGRFIVPQSGTVFQPGVLTPGL